MKTLRRIVLIITAIIVLLIIVAYLLPRHTHIERSLLINSTSNQLFEQVNTLKNWPKWSPWHKIDPNMHIEYLEYAQGVGAKYTWESTNKQVGNGSLTIIESIPFDTIVTEMDFMENGKARSSFIFTKNEFGTLVTWTMESDLGWNPMSRYFGLMMDRLIGPDFEKGLANLRDVAIALPIEPKIANPD